MEYWQNGCQQGAWVPGATASSAAWRPRAAAAAA
eukprot:CAMPEP_0206406458 /NCGR_PEP_ID=MMETSP0294-20121207/29797_1 /ASSEMBLY_ACC=CAM_ASM_000327 /TAXON_ID=39354 /ORGANISM="Heterosigma akashiwo, Strain CCMP2393" /LENGTH=33 /DNA_ID= /DNA_START= /DNA_END= /DNA_ORIENTATION=